jgi:TRAP-type uncharacterized transport system substrate-binding protein
MFKFKALPALFIALIISFAFTANAAVISTGSKSGNYFKVGHNIAGLLTGQDTVNTSKGSWENLLRLVAGDADIAPVQMDAYAAFIAKYPEHKDKLEIMGSLYKECAYLAVQCKGKVRNEDDLQKKDNVTIAIGKKGSGTQVTWDYMIQLEDKYKNASVVFKGGTRAIGQLAAKQVDAVMWVTKPKLDGKMASTVMRNKELCLVGFNDMDLNDKLPATGKPVYEFQKIDTKKGWLNDTELTTACVEAVIIANTNVDEEVLEELADMLLNYKSSIVGK